MKKYTLGNNPGSYESTGIITETSNPITIANAKAIGRGILAPKSLIGRAFLGYTAAEMLLGAMNAASTTYSSKYADFLCRYEPHIALATVAIADRLSWALDEAHWVAFDYLNLGQRRAEEKRAIAKQLIASGGVEAVNGLLIRAINYNHRFGRDHPGKPPGGYFSDSAKIQSRDLFASTLYGPALMSGPCPHKKALAMILAASVLKQAIKDAARDVEVGKDQSFSGMNMSTLRNQEIALSLSRVVSQTGFGGSRGVCDFIYDINESTAEDAPEETAGDTVLNIWNGAWRGLGVPPSWLLVDDCGRKPC